MSEARGSILTPILDLAIQLDEALASAERAARPDAATLAAVARIGRHRSPGATAGQTGSNLT